MFNFSRLCTGLKSGPVAVRPGHFLSRLKADQTGAVALMFIASSVLIFGVSLASIDFIRYSDSKVRVQSALDNAALAAGQENRVNPGASAAQLTDIAREYFKAGLPAGYLGSNVSDSTLSISIVGNNLVADFSGTIPLVSAGLVNSRLLSLSLETKSVVQLHSVGEIEAVFALDKGDHVVRPGNSYVKPDAASQLKLDEGAAKLAQLLMKPEGNPRSDVFVGLVPFSSVVNVGPAVNPNARQWVARWRDAWSDTGVTGDRKRYSNANYTQNAWRGCIAEPAPWNTPVVDVLSPQARFQPVFVRVMTELNEKTSGPDWKGLDLNGLLNTNEEVIKTYTALQIFPTRASGNASYDRRLWAEFLKYDKVYANSKNLPDNAMFRVYGTFEPEPCLDGYSVRFLTNRFEGAGSVSTSLAQISTALANAENEMIVKKNNTDGIMRGDTLLPTGLLWSWRMLNPGWRGGNGWDAQGLANNSETKRRVIVLFAGGQNATWERLAAAPTGNPNLMELWAVDDANQSSFEMDYKAAICDKIKGVEDCVPQAGNRTHKQVPYLPVKKKQDAKAGEWQRPATSVAMADPFSDSVTPSFAGWPAVSQYTRSICDAIKNSPEKISIYVVLNPPENDSKITQSGFDDLKYCAGDNAIYTTSDADLVALRNEILKNVSENRRLKLIQ